MMVIVCNSVGVSVNLFVVYKIVIVNGIYILLVLVMCNLIC